MAIAWRRSPQLKRDPPSKADIAYRPPLADKSRLRPDAVPVNILPAIDRNKGLLLVVVEDDPATASFREALQSLDVIDREIELAVAKWPLDDSAPEIEFESVHPNRMVASFG